MAKKKPSKAPRKAPAITVPEGVLDLPLMRRAAAAVPVLTASRMPLILDAVNSRKNAEYVARKPFADAITEVVDYLDGKIAAPKPNTFIDLTNPATQKKVREEQDEIRDGQNRQWMHLASSELGAAATHERHAYFASEEMTALILAGSAKGVEALALAVSDLPSPSGFAYLYRPDGALFLWWTVAYDSQTVVASVQTAHKMASWLTTDLMDQDPHANLSAAATLSQADTDTAPRVSVHNPFERLGHDGDNDYDRADGKHILPILFSFAHMLRQDIAETDVQETAPAPVTDAKGRRRYRKDRITYLSARRGGASTGVPDPNRQAREYSVRWVVRGHWRRQWYPSQNRHIPIWITDYIAGPDDAPLTHRDKVTMVTS